MAGIWLGFAAALTGAVLAGGVLIALRFHREMRSACTHLDRLGSRVLEMTIAPGFPTR